MSKVVKPKSLPRTKKAARIAIAQDVISRINVLNVSHSYCHFDSFTTNYHYGDERSVKDFFEDVVPHCEVCAKGALFLAHVDFKNKLTIGSLVGNSFDDEEVCSPLLKYFSQEQLDLIEIAFEGDFVNGECAVDYEWGTSFAKKHGLKRRYDDSLYSPYSGKQFFLEDSPIIRRALKFSSKFKDDEKYDKRVLLGIMRNIIRNDGVFIP